MSVVYVGIGYIPATQNIHHLGVSGCSSGAGKQLRHLNLYIGIGYMLPTIGGLYSDNRDICNLVGVCAPFGRVCKWA